MFVVLDIRMSSKFLQRTKTSEMIKQNLLLLHQSQQNYFTAVILIEASLESFWSKCGLQVFVKHTSFSDATKSRMQQKTFFQLQD